MKVAIITDTHYGCRKGSHLFHDYFEQFYKNIFFPTLDKEGIKHVIHMGDVFDSRRGIEFKSLKWSKRVVFEPLKERGITVDMMVGNHDAYYKNTNDVNAVDLLLEEYDNITPYSSTKTVQLDNLKTLYIPWINEDNEEETYKNIENTDATVAFGHLELVGFKVNNYVTMDHGHDPSVYNKFDRVYSGHYHTRSNNGKIFYLGNPYEMFWSDVGDTRGFTILDTETLEHTHVNNPYRLFYSIYYNDDDHQMFDARHLQDKLVKVVVRKKSDPVKFEKFVDKIYSSGVADLKIIENFAFTNLDPGFEDANKNIESEDTMSILDRYIDESETELDKSVIQSIIREIYQEACELV